MAGIAYSASSYINCYNKGYIKSKSGCAGISYSPGGDVNNTFNMGIGIVLAVDSADAEKAVEALKAAGEDAYVIGETESGAQKGVELC